MFTESKLRSSAPALEVRPRQLHHGVQFGTMCSMAIQHYALGTDSSTVPRTPYPYKYSWVPARTSNQATIIVCHTYSARTPTAPCHKLVPLVVLTLYTYVVLVSGPSASLTADTARALAAHAGRSGRPAALCATALFSVVLVTRAEITYLKTYSSHAAPGLAELRVDRLNSNQ